MLRAAEEGGIGLEMKAAAEHAALATRDRKQYGIETHTWREEVRSRAAELGLAPRSSTICSGRAPSASSAAASSEDGQQSRASASTWPAQRA